VLKDFQRAVHVAALLCPFVFMSYTAFAQNATNPQSLAFTPSADHYATTSNGDMLVSQYNLEVYAVGGTDPVQVSTLGKPSPGSDGRIQVPLAGLFTSAIAPNTTYVAKVGAVGPTGVSTSDWSNAFTFVAPTTPVGAFTNGGFESDLSGWTAAGNFEVVLNGAFGSHVSEGTKAIAFNSGQRPANGVISQTFATTPGATYSLSFDIGAFSLMNIDTQLLQVTVRGANTLLSQQTSVSAPGDGVQYFSKSFSFVADTTTATLTFQDLSASTVDVDLFLDNVRVGSAVSAPVITQQPQSATVAAGAAAAFTVGASGGGTLAFQWQFNGTAIAGATGSTYNVASAQPAQAGSYSVVVTNAGGSTRSDAATLSILSPPVVTAQPQNATVAVGSSVSMSVTASGSGPLSYQWRFNGVAIPGATASQYWMTSVQTSNAGTYAVVVTNAAGSVVSSSATLTVTSPTSSSGSTTTPVGLVNGGFESGYVGWTATGNQRLTGNMPVQEGTQAVVFNAGQSVPNGVLSQSFTTVAGKTYALTFSLAAYSRVNRQAQALKVTLTGNKLLLSTTASVSPQNKNTRYSSVTYTFVADGPTTTLTFVDISPTTVDVDLLLDNVRIAQR